MDIDFEIIPEITASKQKILLPFCGFEISTKCKGLKYNRGLFTQCTNNFVKDNQFCGTCLKQSENNDTNKPNCGTIFDRLNVPIMEFRDPKNRIPIPYFKLMAKNGWTKQMVIDEANKQNIIIDHIHFELPMLKIDSEIPYPLPITSLTKQEKRSIKKCKK